jgi:hypothetical protein
MARYKSSYDGERRTVLRATKLTPSEAAALDDEASRQCMNWSDFSRQAMLCRIGMPVTVAKNLWDPRLVQAFTSAGHAHNRVGILLNQIAPYLHITQDLGPFAADLRDALARYNDVTAMHKAALVHFGSL